MSRKKFLILILFISAILAGMNFIATKLHLYFLTFWIDSPTHMMGGFLACLLFWFFVSLTGASDFKKIPRLSTIVAVLTIGIVWEVYELSSGLTDLYDKGFWPDTISDIFSDLFGGLLAYYYLIKPRNVRNK